MARDNRDPAAKGAVRVQLARKVQQVKAAAEGLLGFFEIPTAEKLTGRFARQEAHFGRSGD